VVHENCSVLRSVDAFTMVDDAVKEVTFGAALECFGMEAAFDGK
jgi:hypothetical protein